MADIQLLVVGCGSIGERHIRCLTHVGGVVITPVDPRTERLEAMQRLYGTTPGLTEYDQADLDTFDAVLICTPTNQHIPQAMRAAQAGCHLFVEKPLSTTLDGVQELITYCREHALVLQPGYVYRHMPLFPQIEKALESGELGTVHLIHIKGGYPVERARPDFRSTYWMSAQAGGGVFHDCSHQFEFIQHLISPIIAVTSQKRHFEFEVEEDVEDTGIALLEFAGGAVGTASLNHFQRNRTSRIEIVGNKGTLMWEIDKHNLTVYKDDDRSWHRHRIEQEPDTPYINQAADFLGVLRGEHPPRVTGEDGLRALRVTLAALQSAETGQRVEI